MKIDNMKQENNTPTQLQRLWRSGQITTEIYFFRLKSNELNINTYKFI